MIQRTNFLICLVNMLVIFLLSACGTSPGQSGPTTAPTTGENSSASVGSSESPASGSNPLPVVATYSILGDLVKQVGGPLVDVRVLVTPGSDTHTFEPAPRDSVALSEAALLFENGLAFESWIDSLYAASDAKAMRVVVTQGLEPLPLGDGHTDMDAHEAEGEGDHADEPETEDGHAHGEFDPHVWHDVTNVMYMVRNIRDALAEADPAHADQYQTNAEAYLTQLRELNDWIKTQVQTIPEARRKLITPHDTFRYFAHRYGFEVVGTALGASTEAADPSAGEMAALVEEIKAAGVPAIFAENVQNDTLIERLATEAGVKLVATLYTDALGEPGSDGESYIKLMQHNVNAIVSALKG